MIDETNQDPNYKVYNYKTVWCPYTLEYNRDYVGMIEETALTLTIFKITEEILKISSTFLRNARLGASRTR